jgi:hypothetical protein
MLPGQNCLAEPAGPCLPWPHHWVCGFASKALADAAGQDTRRAVIGFVLTHNVTVSTPAVYDASRSKGDAGVARCTQQASVTEWGGTACS